MASRSTKKPLKRTKSATKARKAYRARKDEIKQRRFEAYHDPNSGYRARRLREQRKYDTEKRDISKYRTPEYRAKENVRRRYLRYIAIHGCEDRELFEKAVQTREKSLRAGRLAYARKCAEARKVENFRKTVKDAVKSAKAATAVLHLQRAKTPRSVSADRH